MRRNKKLAKALPVTGLSFAASQHQALGREQIRAIVDIQLATLRRRLADRDMGIALTEGASDHLAQAGYDPVYGARPLKRAIQSQLENPLAKQILEGRFGPKDVIRVDAKKGVMTFEKLQNAAAAA